MTPEILNMKETMKVVPHKNINLGGNKITVTFQTFTGKAYKVALSPSDNLNVAVYQLNEQQAIPPDNQPIFLFQGQKLELQRTVKSYNIEDQSIILVSFK